jgi:hypothetical protein
MLTLCVTSYLHCRHAYGGGFGFAHPAACEYIDSSSNDSTVYSSAYDSNASDSTSVLEDDPEAVMQVLTAAHAAGMEVCVTVRLRNCCTVYRLTSLKCSGVLVQAHKFTPDRCIAKQTLAMRRCLMACAQSTDNAACLHTSTSQSHAVFRACNYSTTCCVYVSLLLYYCTGSSCKV